GTDGAPQLRHHARRRETLSDRVADAQAEAAVRQRHDVVPVAADHETLARRLVTRRDHGDRRPVVDLQQLLLEGDEHLVFPVGDSEPLERVRDGCGGALVERKVGGVERTWTGPDRRDTSVDLARRAHEWYGQGRFAPGDEVVVERTRIFGGDLVPV